MIHGIDTEWRRHTRKTRVSNGMMESNRYPYFIKTANTYLFTSFFLIWRCYRWMAIALKQAIPAQPTSLCPNPTCSSYSRDWSILLHFAAYDGLRRLFGRCVIHIPVFFMDEPESVAWKLPFNQAADRDQDGLINALVPWFSSPIKSPCQACHLLS